MISFEFVSRRLVSLDTHRCEGIHCCTSEKQNKDQLQLAKSILPSRSSRLVSPKPPPSLYLLSELTAQEGTSS